MKIDDDAIFVSPAEGGEPYPPFVDQPGWMLLNEHLMGKTILDMDGRRTEVVNDVHLLDSKGRMVIVHVDISFNGFLRKWGLGWFRSIKDQLISWRYVQPLSLEDAVASDAVSLSITREQIKELPSEDLADALEELSGRGAAGRVLRAGFGEGGRNAGGGRAPRPAADHRQSAPGAGPHDPLRDVRRRNWPTCSPCCRTTTRWS